MGNTFEALSCPACGAIITENEKVCQYCGRNLVLQNRIIPKNSDKETLVLEASEALHGKKPFLCNRMDIDKCIEYLEKAYEVDQNASIDYFRAYVEYDYFERKHLNRKPGYKFYQERAFSIGITNEDIIKLEKLLKNQIIIGGEKNGQA